MEVWKNVIVDEISEYLTVGFVGSMASEYVDKGVLFLRSQNIEPFKLNLNENQIKYISYEFHKKIKKSQLIPGDIAMVRTGYPGTCCVIPKGLGDLNCSDLVIIRPDHKLVNTIFLCYFLNSSLGKASIDGNLVGAAQQHFNVGVAKKIKISLPPLPNQTKIANILSAYDDLIENNNQRIKLLEEMAEEIYKEWFVRFRFPNYKNTKFIDIEGKEVKHGTIGALPEGWDEKRIKQIGKVITGKTPSKLNEENFNGHIPFIKTPDMQQGMFFIKTEETLSEQGANTQTSQYIPKNSISVSCIGTVGKIGISVEQSQTNQQINSIIPLFNLSLEYIFFSIKRIKPIIESYAATGATMANLSKTKFENLKIIYPSKDLLTLFHKSVNPIFEEIKILMQKNQTLQETRNLLLPRLISGKLSVEDLDQYEDLDSFAENSGRMAAEPIVEYKTE